MWDRSAARDSMRFLKTVNPKRLVAATVCWWGTSGTFGNQAPGCTDRDGNVGQMIRRADQQSGSRRSDELPLHLLVPSRPRPKSCGAMHGGWSCSLTEESRSLAGRPGVHRIKSRMIWPSLRAG